jgi:hypothetical protein
MPREILGIYKNSVRGKYKFEGYLINTFNYKIMFVILRYEFEVSKVAVL